MTIKFKFIIDYINDAIEKHHQSLSIQMSQLGSQLVDLKLAIKQLEKTTTVNCDVNSDFEINWKLLPCNTKEEFETFDERIRTDLDFLQKVVNFYIIVLLFRLYLLRI